MLAEQHNAQYSDPMTYNEVRGIAKSIASYCKSRRYTEVLRKRQAIKGTKGGRVSDSSAGGRARSAQYDKQRQEAEQLYKQGVNKSEIARKLGVARLTVFRWLS